ncbi:MAG: hypothetical protein KI792_07495 [Alphaproteobacteria bacterium]|nr:hypothetical protein [Alphaproteobacteria bacterium SS10]
MFSQFLSHTGIAAAALVAATSLATAQEAKAQNFAEGLEALKEMVLVVERMSEQSEQCGLDRTVLAEQIRAEVADTGLVLAEAGPTLYLNISTAAVGEICFSAVDFSVNYFTQVPHPTKPEGAIAQVVLWDDAFIASSELSNHGSYIGELTAEMAGDFVDDWREANPRSLLVVPEGQPAGNAPILNAAPEN